MTELTPNQTMKQKRAVNRGQSRILPGLQAGDSKRSSLMAVFFHQTNSQGYLIHSKRRFY